MYADSRSYAVDSQMSSAAANRTSTGKATRSPVRSNHASTSASTSVIAARGTAYSISRKTTRRGEVNTAYDRSTNSRAESAREETAFNDRIVRGAAVASRL